MDKRVTKRLLWCCWIVPRRKRTEWFREWHAEVWHWAHFLVESERQSAHTEQELLRHCWGAFSDALWHRLNRVAVLDFLRTYPLSPGFCLIALVIALSVLIAGSPMSRLCPRRRTRNRCREAGGRCESASGLQGMRDALTSQKYLMTPDDMNAILTEMQQEQREKMALAVKEFSEKN